MGELDFFFITQLTRTWRKKSAKLSQTLSRLTEEMRLVVRPSLTESICFKRFYIAVDNILTRIGATAQSHEPGSLSITGHICRTRAVKQLWQSVERTYLTLMEIKLRSRNSSTQKVVRTTYMST